jgi:hypothetical protein
VSIPRSVEFGPVSDFMSSCCMGLEYVTIRYYEIQNRVISRVYNINL